MGQTYEAKGMALDAFTSYLKTNSGTPARLAGLHTAFETGGLRGASGRNSSKEARANPIGHAGKPIFYAHVRRQWARHENALNRALTTIAMGCNS